MATDKKSSTPASKGDQTAEPNEGEGNRAAARHYDKAQAEFARSGKVEPAARAAEEAMEGDERKELERAEAEGRSHAKGEDPKLKR